MKEDVKEKAFKTYLEFGVRRSYERVAKEIGVSSTTICNWSKEGKWLERIERIAKEIKESI